MRELERRALGLDAMRASGNYELSREPIDPSKLIRPPQSSVEEEGSGGGAEKRDGTYGIWVCDGVAIPQADVFEDEAHALALLQSVSLCFCQYLG